MADQAKFTVGVFAGIISTTTGKLLLRRRVEEDSIIPGQSFRGNWELPGGGVMDYEKMAYHLLARELEREVFEELGIRIALNHIPAFYPVTFKGPKGPDLGLITTIVMAEPPHIKGEFLWVTPSELNELAAQFV